jgi:PAS domain S-box-containing protein
VKRLFILQHPSLNGYKQIAERKQAEEAMRESEEKYRTIFENTGTATIIIDEDMTISLINTGFAKLSGYSREEIENRKIFEEFVAKDNIDRIREYHRLRRIDPDTAPMNYEFKFIDKYGNLKDIFATVQMFPGTKKSLGSLLDITDRKKMENELLQVKKLESIGILAGGIAHDFNNLLTAILGNISLAKMYVMEKEVYTHLVEVEKASLRVKDLTQQLLTFSKGGTPVKKTTSIADLIKDSANFALRGSNVKCDFFISPDLWPAEVDEGQISQVINNLIINAQQAMPNGGTIQVQCDNVTM